MKTQAADHFSDKTSRRKNIVYLNNYAKFLFRAGFLEDAIQIYQKSLSLDQNNLSALWQLGSIYKERCNDQAAFHYLWRAFDLSAERHPKKQADPDLALLLGRLHLSRQEFGQAQQKFRYALSLRPEDAKIQEELQNLEVQMALNDQGIPDGLARTLSNRTYEI